MVMAQEVHAFKCSYLWSTSQPHWLGHLMEILVIGLKTNTIDRKYRRLKRTDVLVSSGRDRQILMAVLHSSFSFGLNTLLEMCILLHLSIANKCTIVESEEHEMASFIQTEQCVNVAYLYGPLVINNNRINCKHRMAQSSQ